MSILRLAALGFGLIFLTIAFGTIFVSNKMRKNARKKMLLDPVPWQPNLSQSNVSQPLPEQLLAPHVGMTQERYVIYTEQGYVWTR
jgi:hypothetical protein